MSYDPIYWDVIDDFLISVRQMAEDFRLARQRGQARRLVCMCEAAGMARQLYRATAPYGVPAPSGGGFDSTSDKHRLGEIWARATPPVCVLRIGDCDPSGQARHTVLLEDIGAFATDYGGTVEFVRIAITPKQARARGLPSTPPKPTDHRPRQLIDTETWQAEVLDPNGLAAILEAAILARLDPGIRGEVLTEEIAIWQELLHRFDAGSGYAQTDHNWRLSPRPVPTPVAHRCFR